MADTPEDGLGGRMRTALKMLNMSPAELAATVGVDKSVVSRWLSGKSAPSEFNLARICSAIALRAPKFSILDFERPLADFHRALGLETTSPPREPSGDESAAVGFAALPFSADHLRAAKREVAMRGMEYEGHYDLYHCAFSDPGQIARHAAIIRVCDGLLDVRFGCGDWMFRGSALLMLNRLYMTLTEDRYDSLCHMITNAGQQPRARLLTGIILGVSSDGMLTPTAAPAALVRAGELTGEAELDLAAFQARKPDSPAFRPGPDAEWLLTLLNRDFGPTAHAAGAPFNLTMDHASTEQALRERADGRKANVVPFNSSSTARPQKA